MLLTGSPHVVRNAVRQDAKHWLPAEDGDELCIRHGPGSGWSTVLLLRRAPRPHSFSRRQLKRLALHGCYRCGAPGHRARDCVAEPEPA